VASVGHRQRLPRPACRRGSVSPPPFRTWLSSSGRECPDEAVSGNVAVRSPVFHCLTSYYWASPQAALGSLRLRTRNCGAA